MVAIFPVSGAEVKFSNQEVIRILLGDVGFFPLGNFPRYSKFKLEGECLVIVLDDEDGSTKKL